MVAKNHVSRGENLSKTFFSHGEEEDTKNQLNLSLGLSYGEI